MNILKRHRLKKQQKALMHRYAIMEHLQMEHSEDEYFYKYTQKEMDAIDEEAVVLQIKREANPQINLAS